MDEIKLNREECDIIISKIIYINNKKRLLKDKNN
jgi:hypothetical protein